MSAKDLILNFLYLAFLILLIGGAIIFFIQGDRFSAFATFLRNAWPIAFLLAGLAFKLRLTQNEKARGEGTGNSLRTITLDYSDKMKAECMVFACPLAILCIAAFSEDGVRAVTIVQSIIVLVIVYLWHKYLWLRAR